MTRPSITETQKHSRPQKHFERPQCLERLQSIARGIAPVRQRMDCDFCIQNVPSLLSHSCEVAYNDFLREARVPRWGLTILGRKASEATVSVTDPDRRKLTETMGLTVDTQQEIHRLLLASYKLGNAFNWNSHGANTAGSRSHHADR